MFELPDHYHGLHSAIWIALIAIPVIIFLRNQYCWTTNQRSNGCKPGTVYPNGPLGIGFMMRMSRATRKHNILETFDHLFSSLGPTFWTYNLGARMIATNEPENIKAILSGQFSSWKIGGVRQRTAATAIGPRGIFSVNDQEWQHARALIRPSFVRNQIADLECTDRHVDSFLRRLPRDGRAVDLQELFYMFTMDVSTDFMFGYSTSTLDTPAAEALEFSKSFDYALATVAMQARVSWISFFLPNRRLAEAVKTCQRFVDHHVAQALAGSQTKERPYLFMNEMIESGASQEAVRDQLLAIILGGRDTSASTMSSLFWTLARRPDVVRKMRSEVQTLGGKKPTWEELKDLKYVNMVLKEILRLLSPVPTNSRVASKDTILPKGGGPDGQSPLFVPKGTGCRWSMYSLHRRKDVYGEDADEFRPERWENLRTAWEYLPFSGGPRICIGQQFALTMMLYLVTRMFQTFDGVEAADDEPRLMQVGATTKLVAGCWVKLSPIET